MYIYNTQLPLAKFSMLFIEQFENSIEPYCFLKLLPNRLDARPIEHYTNLITTKICATLKCLLMNTDRVLTDVVIRDFGIRQEEVSSLYRKRVIISSSLCRLHKLDKIDLNQLNFSSEAVIRDFYLTNNIIDEAHLIQIQFPQNYDRINIANLMLSVEIACIYLDVSDISFLPARIICDGESRLDWNCGLASWFLTRFDSDYRRQDVLKYTISYYTILFIHRRITIIASKKGIKSTQMKVSKNDKIIDNIFKHDWTDDYGQGELLVNS